MPDLEPSDINAESIGLATGATVKIDKHIDLGECGMGMPVIRAWQALRKLPVGGVLQMSSSHP
jgi:hypothetical protein